MNTRSKTDKTAQGKPELPGSEAEYQAAIHEWNYGKPQAQQETATACQKTAEVIHCEIRDQFGDVESAGTVLTSLEAYHWYENHGANFDCAKMNDSGFTFQRPPEAIECEPQTDIKQGATLGALLAKHRPQVINTPANPNVVTSQKLDPKKWSEQPQAEHSRLPWEMINGAIFDADAHMVYASNEANAALIVASVNHAEAMAEALADCLELGVGDWDGEEPSFIKKAREALANWEGAK